MILCTACVVHKSRSGTGQWIAEAVAGLLLVILRAPASRVAAMVVAYWFTASTSFANPAAAFGRMFSDSFAGIAPSSVLGFVLAELAGAVLGVVLHGLLGAQLGSQRAQREAGSRSPAQSEAEQRAA